MTFSAHSHKKSQRLRALNVEINMLFTIREDSNSETPAYFGGAVIIAGKIEFLQNIAVFLRIFASYRKWYNMFIGFCPLAKSAFIWYNK